MTTPAASTTTRTATAAANSTALAPDLITRYNLQNKVNSKGKEREDESPAPGWVGSKEARQTMLQRRRDDMILAARRRLQEKDAEHADVVPRS